MQATGEVAAWTSTYGLVYRLAPRRMVSGIMGAFYAVTIGLGGYFAGWVGQFSTPLGYKHYFLIGGLATIAFAISAMAMRKRLLEFAGNYGLTLRSP